MLTKPYIILLILSINHNCNYNNININALNRLSILMYILNQCFDDDDGTL